MAKYRFKIQAFTTLVSNPFVLNFISGKIYKGNLKAICLPGLNCYSCPGSAASCPIGALQAVIGSSQYKFSYYIVGFIIFIGTMLGRFICGFLCPFGWFQELLHKIPSKKLSTKKLKFLKYCKYIILVLFVFILPLLIVNELGMGNPFFCKYLCPAGILGGALPLAIVDSNIRASLGPLFLWKTTLLLSISSLAIVFYRPFCKWICPLGAFYALFNKIAMYTYKIDKDKCTKCNVCSSVCKMDVEVYKKPNHNECIRCGDCINVCQTKAITKAFTIKK